VSRRQLTRVLWGAWFCWAGAILWLSSLSPDELPDAAFALWDKLNHFTAFALGGWLAAAALRVSRPHASPAASAIPAVILVAVFGGLDEALQTLTPGRAGGDLDEWVADALGAAVGALLTLPTLSRLYRPVSDRADRRRTSGD
jgi:VanZ family protein